MWKPVSVVVLAVALLAASEPAPFVLTPDIESALKQVTPNALRGDLSFLASDLLAGRDTPSPGLDIAAEFIASQFRKAGLEPAGDDGYFQTALFTVEDPSKEGFALSLHTADATISVPPADAKITTDSAVDLQNAPIFKLDLTSEGVIDKLNPEELTGKVVVTEPNRENMQRARMAMRKLRAAKPALTIVIAPAEPEASEPATPTSGELIDPQDHSHHRAPRVTISTPEAATFYKHLKAGFASSATASIRISAPGQHQANLRNVAGILRGSDPALKDSYVMVSAHYDHLGVKPTGSGDRIYNGANDDGSGTVSVVELANALATLHQRPKRSILFITFFGEEKGLFGSRYYAEHPLVPIAKTIADVNLEQVGRTDSTEGEERNNATLTGYDFTNLAQYLKAAGKLTGIKLYKNERSSDLYFAASDNLSLAEKGVPANTLCVAFEYPDYHGVADEWQKIDYDNMAKVDRMVALALIMLADSAQVPQWNANNGKAERYLKAWQGSHPK